MGKTYIKIQFKKQELQICSDGFVYQNMERIPIYLNNRGYVMCKLGLLHRVIAEAFVPNPLNLPQVNHKDFNKLNNNVDNLEWATAKDNTNHAIINGMKNTGVSLGSNNGKSILTEKEVKVIKSLFGKLKNKEIARIYNVSPSTISDIKRGATWKDT